MIKGILKVHSVVVLVLLSCFFMPANAQLCEWKLSNVVYSSIDPDAGGPATGSVTFDFEVRSTTGTIPNVTGISVGWAWQSANAMIPTAPSPGTGIVSPGCTSPVNTPANVVVSVSPGWVFNTVNECLVNVQTTGGQTFDRIVIGSLENGSITLTTSFVKVYTVTLWTRGSSNPQGGYAVINSTNLGTPGNFSNYEISDNLANVYQANSLTYNTPLPLGSGTLPVLFTKFEANCTNNGTLVSWSTGSEFNSNYFELQRSINGNDWTSVATVKAAGNSSATRTYQQVDQSGGKAYYRIKEIDLDGHSIYASIISTNCEFKNVDMVIYPVPARDILNVVIQSDKSFKTQLLLVDDIGKIVRKIDATLFKGSNTFLFNLKGLASGEYIIRSNYPGVELNKTFNIIW